MKQLIYLSTVSILQDMLLDSTTSTTTPLAIVTQGALLVALLNRLLVWVKKAGCYESKSLPPSASSINNHFQSFVLANHITPFSPT